jgi:hypothetical protein
VKLTTFSMASAPGRTAWPPHARCVRNLDLQQAQIESAYGERFGLRFF